jgi:hypothetical protein
VCSISEYYVIYIFQAFSIHNFKPVLCIPSQDIVLFIFFRRFQFMILNRNFVFHVRILWYLHFAGVFTSLFWIRFLCSMSGYYGVSIFQAISIHDFKSGLCVPSQDAMLFIFSRRFEFMILNQCCVFHLRILRYLYFLAVFN